MAGRGRGRGRARVVLDLDNTAPGGLAGRNAENEDDDVTPHTAQQNGDQKEDTKPSTSLSLSDMKSIIEDPRTYSETNDVKKVLMCARHFVKSEDDVKTLASLLYNNCLNDSSLSKQGAAICDCLSFIQHGNSIFRNCLLALVQQDYKGREELLSSDPAKFRGFLAFLCEIFNVMRTALNEVFKPLVGPIFDCFNLPLGQDEDSQETETLNEDVCELFALQLQSSGKLLEENEPERMKSLMNRIRTSIIHSKNSPRARCSLLEVLESYVRGWECAESETTQFYCDMAVDIISGLVL